MKQNAIWLQMPTEIVRNINFTICEKSFIVYGYLLFLKFKNHGKLDIELSINNLKLATAITDNRTIKKCLKELHGQGLIKEVVEKLPVNKPLHITILEPYRKDFFTQLPIELMKRVNEVGFIGFRLMYYYESYINRRTVSKLFSYPSFKMIEEDLKISNHSITKYNKLLTEKKLIKVTKHKSENDPFGDGGFEKFNNHYQVNISNL